MNLRFCRWIRSFCLLTMLLLTTACTQTGTALLNTLAKSDNYVRLADIQYGRHQENALDIYHPAKPINPLADSKKPVLVFFYGGCWGECNSVQKADYQFVAQPFVEQGYVTVIPRFREYPKVRFDGIMEDTANAVGWVIDNIANYGGDPKRIVLMGHSSGAHIAAMLNFNPRYLGEAYHQNIRGFVGLAGPYDFLPLDEAYQRVLFAPESRYAASQPINFVSANSPPSFILHGEKDTTVGRHNAVNLERQSQRVGGTVTLTLYPQHDHVGILLALSKPFRHRSTVLQDIFNFIENK